MLRAVVLAALVAATLGANVYWKGCTNDLSKDYNWEDQRNPTNPASAVPREIIVGGDRKVDVYAPPRTEPYKFGKTWTFRNGVRLVFGSAPEGSSDNIRITFDENATGSTATFVGGQVFDACHDVLNFDNWGITKSATTGGSPFCSGDTGIFPGPVTYSVYASQPQKYLSASFEYPEGTEFTACDALPAPMFSKIAEENCDMFKDYSQALDDCTADFFFDEANQRCYCYTTFPSPEEQVKIDEILTAVEEAKAEARDAALSVEVSRTFSYDVTATELTLDSTFFDELYAPSTGFVTGDTDRSAALRTAVANIIVERFVLGSSSDLTGFTITASSGKMTVAGTMNVEKRRVASEGQDPADIPDTGDISTDERFALTYPAFLQVAYDTKAATVPGQRAACNDECVNIKLLYESLVKYADNSIDVLEAVQSCSDATACQAVFDSIQFGSGATESDKDAVAAVFANFPITDTNEQNLVKTYTDMLKLADALDTLPDILTQYTAPVFYLGHDLTYNLRRIFINPTNGNNYTMALQEALEGSYGIQDVKVTSIVISTSARRATESLAVTFDYTKFCTDCPIQVDSASYDDIQFSLDTATSNFEPQSHSDCYNINTNSYDKPCIYALADLKCNTTSYDAARSAVRYVVLCDPSGYKPDGTCYAEQQAVDSIVESYLTSDVCVQAKDTSTIDKSTGGGGGGGSSMGMVVGAAAGGLLLLLLVLLVILLMRRRNRSTGTRAASSSDRNVVAFENPMYDDPGHAVAASTAQPVYDDNGADGLYDEPAFNADTKKSNPLYSSNEDLTAGADTSGYLDTAPADEGAGYLDTAPVDDGAGYLDTEPVAAEEDGGYLDVNPNDQQ